MATHADRVNQWEAKALLLAALLLAAAPATATNGYFSHGYSAAQRAVAGAGSALPTDALGVAINPANLVWVPEQININVGLFSPKRWIEAGPRGDAADTGIFTVAEGEVRSKRERFVIPALAYTAPLDDHSSWGIALYGNGGMNTEYRGHAAQFAQGLGPFETQCQGSFGGGPPSPGFDDQNGFCGNGISTASVDLIQLFVVPSYSVRVFENTAVGIAPVLAYQRFRALGLKAFAKFSNAPDKISDNSYDYSWGTGLRLGIRTAPTEWLSLAGSWQSRVLMTPFEDYAGLFADGGDFDIPSNWNLGLALQLGAQHRVLVDYQRVNYSEVLAVGNPLDPNRFVNECALPRLRGDTAANPNCLGSATGPGFGWQDVSTRKFGYEFQSERFTWRAGYSRNGQPIRASEVLFNILAPAVPEVHYTAGLAYVLDGRWSAELSLMYAENNPVTGKNPLSNSTATQMELFSELAVAGSGNTETAFGADPQDQDLRLQMRQYEVMLGLSYHF